MKKVMEISIYHSLQVSFENESSPASVSHKSTQEEIKMIRERGESQIQSPLNVNQKKPINFSPPLSLSLCAQQREMTLYTTELLFSFYSHSL